VKRAKAEAVKLDDLGTTESGETGFGSTDLSLKRSITAKEAAIKICFLHTELSDNEFFSTPDIGYHPRFLRETEMLPTAHVNAALTRTMNDAFLDKIKVARTEHEKCQGRGREVVRLTESHKKMPDEWM